MTNYNSEDAMPLSLAKRKERLLREGASYRKAIQKARLTVNSNLHTNVLARSAIAQIKGSMFSMLGNVFKIRGGNLQTLLPVAVSVLSFARKAKLVRPLLGGGLVLGAVALGVTVVVRRKKRKASPSRPAIR